MMQTMAAPQQQVTYAQAPQMMMQTMAAPQKMTYAAMPMAEAQVGNTIVVGQDLNQDGIPDVLETFAQPQVTYAQAPQVMQTMAAPQMMTYAQPQMTYAQPQMIEQVMQEPPMTTSVIQSEPVVYGTQQMQMQQIIMEAAPPVYIQAPAPQVEVREVVREMVVPQIQTIEKIVEIPQVMVQEQIREVYVTVCQEVVRQVPVPQIQTVEKIIEVPQIQTVEEVMPVPQVS